MAASPAHQIRPALRRHALCGQPGQPHPQALNPAASSSKIDGAPGIPRSRSTTSCCLPAMATTRWWRPSPAGACWRKCRRGQAFCQQQAAPCILEAPGARSLSVCQQQCSWRGHQQPHRQRPAGRRRFAPGERCCAQRQPGGDAGPRQRQGDGPPLLNQIFEPFFTTRSQGTGPVLRWCSRW